MMRESWECLYPLYPRHNLAHISYPQEALLIQRITCNPYRKWPTAFFLSLAWVICNWLWLYLHMHLQDLHVIMGWNPKLTEIERQCQPREGYGGSTGGQCWNFQNPIKLVTLRIPGMQPAKRIEYGYLLQRGWVLQTYAKPKKPDPRGPVLRDSTSTKYPEQLNPQKQKAD